MYQSRFFHIFRHNSTNLKLQEHQSIMVVCLNLCRSASKFLNLTYFSMLLETFPFFSSILNSYIHHPYFQGIMIAYLNYYVFSNRAFCLFDCLTYQIPSFYYTNSSFGSILLIQYGQHLLLDTLIFSTFTLFMIKKPFNHWMAFLTFLF